MFSATTRALILQRVEIAFHFGDCVAHLHAQQEIFGVGEDLLNPERPDWATKPEDCVGRITFYLMPVIKVINNYDWDSEPHENKLHA